MGILFKKTNLFVLTVLTCSMTLFSSGDRELVEINRIVAKVNDRIITWGEIERKMAQSIAENPKLFAQNTL